MAHIFEEDDKLIKENKVDTTSIDACERPKPANYAVRLFMFARLVYAMLSFCARKFPEKSEIREPREIMVECTSYLTNFTAVYGFKFSVLSILCTLNVLCIAEVLYTNFVFVADFDVSLRVDVIIVDDFSSFSLITFSVEVPIATTKGC